MAVSSAPSPSSAPIPPPLPALSQRLAQRTRPGGQPVMYQDWRELLFLHWEYEAAVLQARLPEGLWVDTFNGKAYLGVVPFLMRGVRPRFLPTVPGISNFLELNLRTYVYDRAGVPGVWFFSLDANQALAVTLAQRLFHLPYEHAQMSISRPAAGRLCLRSRRRGAQAEGQGSVFDFTAGPPLPPPEPGSLEFFLVERYRLYAQTPRGLRRGTVHHEPYPLRQAHLTTWDEKLLPLDGFASTGRPPDHVAMSHGVSVSIFPLETV